MALTKITDGDLAGKGVLGQSDVPGLSAHDMQYAVEQITREVVIPVLNANVDEQEGVNAQVLRKDNTAAWAPDADYEPATKKYVDDAQFAAGSVSSVFGRAGNVSARTGDYNGAQVTLAGYAKPGSSAPLAAGDTVNQALGKLEKGQEGKAPLAHSARHAAGGDDPLTPEAIGAAAAGELAAYATLLENISTEKTAGWTAAAADLGKTFLLANTGALVVTLPFDSDAALPVGFGFYLRRWGAGSVSVAGDTRTAEGVEQTVNINGTVSPVLLGEQYAAVAAVVKVAADSWAVNGGLD